MKIAPIKLKRCSKNSIKIHITQVVAPVITGDIIKYPYLSKFGAFGGNVPLFSISYIVIAVNTEFIFPVFKINFQYH